MQPAEKRKNPRRAVRYPASIDLGEGAGPIHCTLHDVSQGGAQIHLVKPANLPDEFTLALGYDGTAHRRCRVKWRRGNRLGVQYQKTTGSLGRMLSLGK